MRAFTALLALLPAVLVAAQSGTSVDGAIQSAAASVPSCALTCTISSAGSSSCGGIGNIQCLCTDQAFQSAVYQCYQNTCSTSDRDAAIAYGAQICQGVGVTLDTTATPSGITAASRSSTSAPASQTTSAPTSSQTSQTSSVSSAAPASSPTGAGSRSAAAGGIVAALAGTLGLVAML